MAAPRKTTYIAVDPAGVTHKRTTKDRTYTNTVVRKGGYQTAIRMAYEASTPKILQSDFRYYSAIVAGNNPYPARNWAGTPEGAAQAAQEDAKRLEEAKKALMGATTLDAYCALCCNRRLAQVEEARVAGEYDRWDNLGWQGRPDLAQGIASKFQGNPDYEVRILEAKAI